MTTTGPWSHERKVAAAERGAHPSAHQHSEFLRDEMLKMCRRRQWTVLPLDVVLHELELRLSPPGVIPQRDRRPRTIIDYTYSGVNQETVRLAPPEAMQFGDALHRILYLIFHADPRWGPVYLDKIDITDGFYQKWLELIGVLKLGAIMPPGPDGSLSVAFPLGLPMGWTESPPAFCAGTETIADMANASYRANASPPPHRNDDIADTPTPPLDHYRPMEKGRFRRLLAVAVAGRRRRHPPRRGKPLANTDVFVDDFVSVAQGNPRRRRRLRRILFHAIDSVFRPPHADDPDRADPISLKKLLKGDGAWETVKIVLGWLIDTLAGTVELPPHRIDRLREILADFPRTRKRASLTAWYRLLGELRSMILAIPGGRGMFSMLQAALVRSNRGRVCLTTAVHDQIDDFRWLFEQLAARPTRIAEIVPGPEDYLGAHDAAGPGMGGVWLPDDDSTVDPAGTTIAPSSPLVDPCRPLKLSDPILWRDPFPDEIRRLLVSFKNLRGTITNSDLELAGSIAHNDVLAQEVDLTEANTAAGTDNTPTLAWRGKGSTTTTGPAGYLLRLFALHQRAYRYQSRDFFIPGTANCMADDCSRLFHLSDTDLVAHFNSRYPQKRSWQLRHLRPEMSSALISSLLQKRVPPGEILPEQTAGRACGQCGCNSAPSAASTTSLNPSPIRSLCSRLSLGGTMTAASPCVATRLGLERLKTPYAPLAKRSHCWGPRTLA